MGSLLTSSVRRSYALSTMSRATFQKRCSSPPGVTEPSISPFFTVLAYQPEAAIDLRLSHHAHPKGPPHTIQLGHPLPPAVNRSDSLTIVAQSCRCSPECGVFATLVIIPYREAEISGEFATNLHAPKLVEGVFLAGRIIGLGPRPLRFGLPCPRVGF